MPPETFARCASFARNHIYATVLASSALFVGSALLLPVAFDDNDDPCMLLIASGGYTGTPDAHLVFVNYYYGLSLKFLYSHWPAVEWYSLTFVILNAVSLSIIIYSLVTQSCSAVLKCLLVALFCLISLKLLLRLQFTTTAALVTLAGIVLLKEEHNYRRLIGTLLLVIGTLIRFEAAILLVIVASPLFLGESLERRKFVWTASMAFLALAVLVAGVLQYADRAHYQREAAWREYREYNFLRGRVNDNPNAAQAKGELTRLISEHDYVLLMQFLGNWSVIDLDMMRSLYRAVGDVPVASKLHNIVPALWFQAEYLLPFALLVIALSFATPEAPRRWQLWLGCTLFLFAICLVAHDGALKYRVFVTAMLPLLYLFALHAARLPPARRHLAVHVCLALVVALFSLSVVKNVVANAEQDSVMDEQSALIGEYLADSTKSVIPFKGNYRIESLHPLSVSRRHSNFNGRVFFGGWFTGNPLNKGRFEDFRAFVDGRGLFLNKESQWIVPSIVHSIQDSYGLRVSPTVVAESPLYDIIEFRSQSAETEPHGGSADSRLD